MKCKDAVQPLGDCSLKCNCVFELPRASQSSVLQKHQLSNLLTLSYTCVGLLSPGAGQHSGLPLAHGGQTAGKQRRILFFGSQRKDVITVWTQEQAEENLPSVGIPAPADLGEFFKGGWIMCELFLNESWGFQSPAARNPPLWILPVWVSLHSEEASW